MSFLRRLLGGTPTRRLNVSITYFSRVRDDATLDVVGEAYRQELVNAARPPGQGDLPPGLPAPPAGYYKAMLVPEPTNQYDRNAISIFLWAGGNWSLAGYLSRSDAVRYQPLFRHLAMDSGALPPAISCDAALTSEGGGTGVVMHLGTPGECVAELATDNLTRFEHRWVGKYVAFTGQGGSSLHEVPLDREAQLFLARWAGCEVLPRVTKKTDALVVADHDQSTANLKKARDYGVEVVEELDFLSAIGMAAESIAHVTGRWAQR